MGLITEPTRARDRNRDREAEKEGMDTRGKGGEWMSWETGTDTVHY